MLSLFSVNKMMVKQTKYQVIRYSFTNAFIATFAIVLGTVLSGIFHQDYIKIFTFEYAIVFISGFFAAAFLIWLTAKRDLEINIDKCGLTVKYNQENNTFSWNDVANIKRPSLLFPRWLFLLKKGNAIKVQINIFNKSQSRLLNMEIQKYI